MSLDGVDLGILKAFPPRQACCPASPESWSPDNRFYAYSGPNGRHRVLDTKTGEDQPLFDHAADPSVDEWDFPSVRWSPDGTYVVVVGFSTRTETWLWEGVTYENVTRLMASKR